MAKNDVVLLDGVLDERIREKFPSNDPGEVFEFLAFEQLLKDYDPSTEDIEAGWVDGEKDGGVDGFFTFVNGYLVQDLDRLILPRREALIEVWIITAKHHSSFQLAPLNSLMASLPELLDLGKEEANLKGKYSVELLRARSIFHLTYRRLAATRPKLSFNIRYVSRGEASVVPNEIAARAKQISEQCKEFYSDCVAQFDFIGASELVTCYRRTKKFSIDLPILECLTHEQGSYVVLARLADYFRFVTDDNGQLRRYLFDSNVRDYLGENRVNEDIAETLQIKGGPDFWWLNNGVTILSTTATLLGKTIQIQDIQIVNGLQTTETIFRHFSANSAGSDSRSVLVKVVVSDDPVVRDNIIRATNNQSVVQLASLHATDKIQRDIEAVLERKGWFYERRTNYYRNIGRPQVRMVTPLFIAAGHIALVLKNPSQAAILKSRFMRDPIAYSTVFSEKLPLAAWPIIVEIVKRIESGLIVARPPEWHGERFLATFRNILAFAVVAKITKTFAYSLDDLISIDVAKVNDALVTDLWKLAYALDPYALKKKLKLRAFCQRFYQAVADEYKLSGLKKIAEKPLSAISAIPKRLQEEFIDKVDEFLPKQPWKPGIHQTLAKKLSCAPSAVSAAIQELVLRGRRMRQKDGVVYNVEGEIVAYDPDRVEKYSLGL